MEPQPANEPRRSILPLAGTVGVAAIVGAFFYFHGHRTNGPLPTRNKGGNVLHVYRQQGGGSEELLSGELFSAGDRIRFALDLAAPSRVQIVGVQEDGTLYTAWPPPGDPSKPILPAGQGQILDGAVTLDQTLGREMLYSVTCPPAMGRIQCRSMGAGQLPECPAQCDLSPFMLVKGKSRAPWAPSAAVGTP